MSLHFGKVFILWAIADNGNTIARNSRSFDENSLVRFVDRNDLVRPTATKSLEKEQQPMQQRTAAVKTHFVHLGCEVVVVKDKSFSKQLVKHADGNDRNRGGYERG